MEETITRFLIAYGFKYESYMSHAEHSLLRNGFMTGAQMTVSEKVFISELRTRIREASEKYNERPTFCEKCTSL